MLNLASLRQVGDNLKTHKTVCPTKHLNSINFHRKLKKMSCMAHPNTRVCLGVI